MVSVIDREKNHKRMLKTYIIIGAVVYALTLLTIFHMAAIMHDNPRASIEEAMAVAIEEILLPGKFFHMRVTSQLMMWVGIGTVMAATLIFVYVNDAALKKHDNPETVNGEAHLMNSQELKNFNKRRTDPIGKETSDGPNNMILSRDIKLALDGKKTRRNCNVLVIGGSGAGKSRFFAAPNILQYNANFVITDPSGEMLEDYGKALEDHGYRVRVFNLTDVYKGNRYNPFHYITDEKDVFVLVETLIKNTTPPNKGSSDPFWENSEKLLITALILYLWHVPDAKLKKEGLARDFRSVTKMLDMAEVDENDDSRESKLDTLFIELAEVDPENLAVQNYHSFRQAAGKTMKSILISVNVRLKAFRLSDIQYLTGKDEFEFEKFADTRQALFVIIPTADTTFNFLVSLMYSQLFTSLYNYVETRAKYGWEAYVNDLNIIRVEQAYGLKQSRKAKKKIVSFVKEVKEGTVIKPNNKKRLWEIYTKQGTLVGWRGQKKKAIEFQESLSKLKVRKAPRKCPNHVRLILDEFANIGQIPDFDAKLATIRKYEISCSIILQAISQLKDLYDKKWNTIAANCDEKLFLGCDDEDTIEWLLKMLGKKTTNVENMSFQGNGNGSTSYNRSSIELLTIDQITMMDDDECIVRIRGERPYYGKKYELTAHPNYNYAQKTAGTFVIPASENAYKHKQSGPLRERKKDMEEQIKQAEITHSRETAKNNSPIHATPSSSMRPSQRITGRPSMKQFVADNARRKQEAQQARSIADAMESLPPEEQENLNKQIIDAFGIKPGSTDAQIKERIESMINLEHPSLENIYYNATA